MIMFKIILAGIVGAVTTIGAAHAAGETDSVICPNRADAEAVLAAVMETPSLQAGADMADAEAVINKLVAAGSCRMTTFLSTDGDLAEHQEGGAYVGIVDVDGEWAVDVDFALFRQL
jgi:hypothetical protein